MDQTPLLFSKARAILIAAFALSTFHADAQNMNEKLETLKRRYFEVTDSINAKSPSDRQYVSARCNELLKRADDIILNGNYDQANTARYCKVGAMCNLLNVHSGSTRDQYAYALLIKPDADLVLKNTIFPLTYKPAGGTGRTATKSSYANKTYYSFYAVLARFAFELGDHATARKYTELLWQEPDMSPLNKAQAGNNILLIDRRKGPWGKESMEILYATTEIVSQKLGAEDKKAYLKGGNTPVPTLAYIFLLQLDSVRGLDDAGEKAYDMARFASTEPLRSDWDVWQLYQYALKKGLREKEILAYILQQLRESHFVIAMDEDDHSKECEAQMKETGIKLLRETAKEIKDDQCAELQKVYDQFVLLGDVDGAATYMTKLDRCNKTANEKHKKFLRNQERANGYSHLYLGIYPFPLIFSNVELQLDLRSRKRAHSLGFGLIRERQDWNARLYNGVDGDDDLTWYGYRFNYASKFFRLSGSPAYAGFMFGYSSKNFRVPPVEATVDGTPGTYEFKPVEKQFEIFFLTGFQALKKLMGTEMSFAAGMSFNSFNGGNEIWGQPNVVINNKFLATRKELTVYPQFRFTWSFGLYLHPRGVKL